MKSAEGGEIIYYKGHPAMIIGYTINKNIIVQPLTDEGKDHCPHCGKPLPTQHFEAEGSLNYQERVKPVKTL